MQGDDEAILEKNSFQESVSKFKTNRIVQITSVFIVLALISIPAYSMYSKYNTPEDEYQKELEYFVDYDDYGYITWTSQSNLELNDGEVFTLSLTNEDFPEEAKEVNIVGLILMISVSDNSDDNEETSGAGCAIDSGEDAFDSVSASISVPNDESEIIEIESTTSMFFMLFDEPEFDTYPFITGYTVKEIEEMFETGDEIIGEYNFQFTGNVESGDSTFQCERQDPSVTISYEIELEWADYTVIEWNADFWF